MPGAAAWGQAPPPLACVVSLPCLASVPSLCAAQSWRQVVADSDAAPLLIMRMLSGPLCHCGVPGRAVPLGMGSSDVGFKLPELSLGPELFVTWQSRCPLSWALLPAPSVPLLAAVGFVPGTEAQRLAWLADDGSRWSRACVLHTLAGPDTARESVPRECAPRPHSASFMPPSSGRSGSAGSISEDTGGPAEAKERRKWPRELLAETQADDRGRRFCIRPQAPSLGTQPLPGKEQAGHLHFTPRWAHMVFR